jgi:hypothetical protein
MSSFLLETCGTTRSVSFDRIHVRSEICQVQAEDGADNDRDDQLRTIDQGSMRGGSFGSVSDNAVIVPGGSRSAKSCPGKNRKNCVSTQLLRFADGRSLDMKLAWHLKCIDQIRSMGAADRNTDDHLVGRNASVSG